MFALKDFKNGCSTPLNGFEWTDALFEIGESIYTEFFRFRIGSGGMDAKNRIVYVTNYIFDCA